MNKKTVAHFLNSVYLQGSPPNDALSRAYKQNGFAVTFFSPRNIDDIKPVSYGFRWLLKNALNPKWRAYSGFSATSEDPIAIAGILAFIWRKPLIFLSDEIKSGSYVGNRSKSWKALCRWAMRKASLTIVNDYARIDLQSEYARLPNHANIIVYPGCYFKPPQLGDKTELRKKWSMENEDVVLGFSGGCNLSAGLDWVLDSLMNSQLDIKMIAQPLSLDPLNTYLLKNHRNIDKVYLEEKRLTWHESWSSMGGVDIGVAIYLNQAPQFQLMGISSNRLCMFLAMGVPVIVSKQASFRFIEEYNCGVLVENAEQFEEAVKTIKADLDNMKKNALKCAQEYIDTNGKYNQLVSSVNTALR